MARALFALAALAAVAMANLPDKWWEDTKGEQIMTVSDFERIVG